MTTMKEIARRAEQGEISPHMSDDKDLLAAAKVAAATIASIYQWVEMVEQAGDAGSAAGVAKCHAMIKSLRQNAPRIALMVMDPLRKSIAKAEGDAS